jgi:hypothetical protein
MNILRVSSRTLLLATVVMLAPTHNRALSPLIPMALFTAPSLWVHHNTLPWDGKNRYSWKELKKALQEIKAGINVQENMKVVRRNLYYLYIDGVCGHGSKVGSPRFNEKTGMHEIPAVDSRGIFGFVSDRLEPTLKVAEFVGKAGLTVLGIQKGYEFWQAMYNAKDFASFKAAITGSAVPAKDAKEYKPITKMVP